MNYSPKIPRETPRKPWMQQRLPQSLGQQSPQAMQQSSRKSKRQFLQQGQYQIEIPPDKVVEFKSRYSIPMSPDESCILQDSNRIFFPEFEVILLHIANDPFYYRVLIPEDGISRRQLFLSAGKWLNMRNAYYNLSCYVDQISACLGTDHGILYENPNTNLVIHRLEYSGEYRDYSVFDIMVSS